MNKDKRIQFLSQLRAENPNPTTELNFANAFELLIAVMLSAQSTDVGVNKATAKLFPVANTPQSILGLGLRGLKEYIKTIGLFNSKAKHILATCKILLEEHDGEVPQTRAALEALPGVGRKTANVVLNTAFGQPTMAVDTHIYRVSNRTGFARQDSARSREKVDEGHSPRIYGRCPSLADSAWALHLSSTQPQVLGVFSVRRVRLPRQTKASRQGPRYRMSYRFRRR